MVTEGGIIVKYLLRLISLFLWFWSFIFAIAGVTIIISNNFNIAAILLFSVIVLTSGYTAKVLWGKTVENNKLTDVSKNLDEAPIEIELTKTDVPPSNLNQMKKFYTEVQLQNDLRILQESVDLMKSTRNLETYLDRYDLAGRTALNIEQAKKAGVPVHQKHISFKELRELTDKLMPQKLNDSYLMMKMDAYQLKTVKGQLGRFEKYLELLNDYEFDLDFAGNYEQIVSKVEDDISNLTKQL